VFFFSRPSFRAAVSALQRLLVLFHSCFLFVTILWLHMYESYSTTRCRPWSCDNGGQRGHTWELCNSTSSDRKVTGFCKLFLMCQCSARRDLNTTQLCRCKHQRQVHLHYTLRRFNADTCTTTQTQRANIFQPVDFIRKDLCPVSTIPLSFFRCRFAVLYRCKIPLFCKNYARKFRSVTAVNGKKLP